MEPIVGVWLTSLVGAAAFSVAGYVLGQRGASIPLLKIQPPPEPATPPLPLPVLPPPLPHQPLSSMPTPAVAVPTRNTAAAEEERSTPDFARHVDVSDSQRPPPMPPPLVSSSPPTGAGRYSKTPKAPEVAAALAATEAEVRNINAYVAGDDEDDEEERPTLAPNAMEHAAVLAAAVATIPPPRTPSFRAGGGSSGMSGLGGLGNTSSDRGALAEELESTKSELRAALLRAESTAQRARAAEVVRAELEKQIEVLRADLKLQVVARATAETRAEELGDRLAGASEEASSLRHKVSLLDRQTKQLREALQGRVRALTTSEWHRRRDLEEAEEMRVKLRDVYDKIERTSLPPDAAGGVVSGSGGGGSIPPHSQMLSSTTTTTATTSDKPKPITSPGMPAPPSLRPSGSMAAVGGPDDDIVHLVNALRSENTRLAAENQALRAQRQFANAPAKAMPSRDSVPELDLDIYRTLIERCGSVAGLRGAVIADELGSLLVGSGELAEGLAAFGAYIKDASARTDRLLPLDGVEEVDIRDRAGLLLCTRVVTRLPSELSLVLLGQADASIAAAKNIAEETLRLR